jgi:hypothetical protein
MFHTTMMQAYAFCLCQAAESPLVEVGRSVYGSCIGILDEWLANDVHCESLTILQIRNCVFDATRTAVVACE